MILTITLNPAVDTVYAVDHFAVGGVFRPRDLTRTAGGKGLNVTRVARLLGREVTATGFIGGSAGAFIDAEVRALGARSRFVEIGGETRTCIAIADRAGGTSTELLEPGPAIGPAEAEAFMAIYAELLPGCRVVAACGSLPRGLPDDFYRRLCELARAAGKPFILDTSGAPLALGIEGLPHMIKPNREELVALLGRPVEDLSGMGRALRELSKRGIALPCATLGRDGCLAALADGVYHYTAPPVEAVNTVGSGDAFVAGCAAILSDGGEADEAIRLGMACGLANTQFFQTGMISRELVDKFHASVVRERIAGL
ncbi:MAG: 1-phosphofructokinase family hexose kinase [Patescibacteria group bacterium]